MLTLTRLRRNKVPTIYIKKELYDAIVKMGDDVSEYVNRVVEESLKKKGTPKER